MCLAQDHNAVMPVRLEPVASRSRVKHSITEPLHSQPSWDTKLMNASLYIYSKTSLISILLDQSFYLELFELKVNI